MNPTEQKSQQQSMLRTIIDALTAREWALVGVGTFCTFCAAVFFYSIGEDIGRSRGDPETIVRVITVDSRGVEKVREFKKIIE